MGSDRRILECRDLRKAFAVLAIAQLIIVPSAAEERGGDSMPEKTYASFFEEFEAFWKEVKEGGKLGEYEHFQLDAILGAKVDQDWSLGVKMDGIDGDIYWQTKESIVNGIMENGPYARHGGNILTPLFKHLNNTNDRQGFTVNDMELFYTRSSFMHAYLIGGQMMTLAHCTDDHNKDFVGITLASHKFPFQTSALDLEKTRENIGIIVRAIDEARKQPSDPPG